MTRIELTDNKVLEIVVDESPFSPRENDNLGVMLCMHSRHSLGDKHSHKSSHFAGWTDFEHYIHTQLDAAICLPLYLYDHSGINISTSPFACRWDSSQVGFIYVSKKDLRNEYHVQRITSKILEKAKKVIEAEVKVYNDYIAGDVHGFILYKKSKCDQSHEHKEEINSCWGFYGDLAKSGIMDYIDVSEDDKKLILGEF